MVQIPEDGILIFDGDTADIPSGWERYTAANSRILVGCDSGTDPGGTNGTSTHTHTSNNHTHSESHTHSLTYTGTAPHTITLQSGTLG